MRKLIERSEIWMTILGGLLYHIIFVNIIANSFYTTFPRIILALLTLIFGPIIFFLLDYMLKRVIQEIIEEGFKNACKIFLRLHVIWVPSILITVILYVLSKAIYFSAVITSPKVIISTILLIIYMIKGYIIITNLLDE